MKSKSIKIDQLTEGYNVTNLETMDVYGVTKSMLINKVKLLLGITESKPTPTPKESPVSAQQKIKELAQARDPDGLLIPKFDYDPAQEKKLEHYSNMFMVELPDGRVMIRYNEAHYYTTKDKVMQVPYPTTKKYFVGTGISTTAQICLRAYRQHLHLTSIQKEKTEPKPEPTPSGSEDGTCDDITFDSCANNSPENCKYCVGESRYENKNKLASKKLSPPLMKAIIPP